MGTLRPPALLPRKTSPRIARHTSRPSMTGIRMSRITKSGLSLRNASRPACPSAASVTSNPARRSAKQTTSRMWESSSTTRTLRIRTILPL